MPPENSRQLIVFCFKGYRERPVAPNELMKSYLTILEKKTIRAERYFPQFRAEWIGFL